MIHRTAVATLAAVTLTLHAGASEPDRVQVAAGLGYALPGGSLERGSRVSDASFGLVPLELDAAYRLHRLFSAGIAVRYGLSIPTLCGTGSECISSLGHDAAVDVLGRWHVGTWRAFSPDVDLRLGYEWFVAKNVDNGVTSRRSYRGFEAALRGFAAFELSRVFAIGPTLGVGLGSFSHVALEAPAISRSEATDGTAFHVWITLGFGARGSF